MSDGDDSDRWREKLTPEQHRILREKGTEPPFSGKYVHPGFTGTFVCAGCGAKLFDSKRQFDSGSGWPSFDDVIDAKAVALKEDHSIGEVREEVVCAACDGHLGHLFSDGPTPTGQRYCINSAALGLERK